MRINNKKSITLQNRTNYFDPTRSKDYVTFSSPETYQSRMIKREGYESRLYWQFKYCDDHDGQTFFYTLTYNDSSIPKFMGKNCFDYEDLRYLLTGGFNKRLLRDYGTKLRYFVGAELGDGKGERGLHNNPHYHILFFLEPANNSKYPYRKIDPVEFRHWIRMYWQGFDQDIQKKSFRKSTYGIVKEGKFNNGLVTDFRAVQYVSKYVTKDIELVKYEKDIDRRIRIQYQRNLYSDIESYRCFFYGFIYNTYNIATNPQKTQWFYDDYCLIDHLLPGYDFLCEDINFIDVVKRIVDKYNLQREFDYFTYMYSDRLVYDTLRTYRNRYCNKCRISHGVGDYALQHIADKLDPYIPIPGKKGIKHRPINLYYYRKLYCNVVKDDRGQNCYVLNNFGIQYKVNRLPMQLEKKRQTVAGHLAVLTGPDGRTLYNKMRQSDVNNTVFMDYDEFITSINTLDTNKILNSYGEYKLVYEGRSFKLDKYNNMPVINVLDDYQWFITPTIGTVPYIHCGASWYNQYFGKDYLPYSEHPYFSQMLGIYSVFDLCADYFFVQKDNRNQREAEEIQSVKRFHRDREMKSYYGNFEN